MGWSLSWLAVQGKQPGEVQAALGLKATGTTCIVAEAPFSGAQLPNGWYVVVADHDFRFLEEPATTTAIASMGGNAVACGVEEHTMVSGAKAWRDGNLLWSVSHDGSGGGRDLHCEGRLPEGFEKTRADALAQYEDEPMGVDFVFDVPLDLAEALTEFRHDSSELEFAVLELINPPKPMTTQKPWWKLW